MVSCREQCSPLGAALRHDDHEKLHRDGRIPDAWWERLEPLLPPRTPHPLGCHRPRVEDRQAMDAIFFVLRTGSQWNALKATGLCCSRSAHRRFQEWTAADVFRALWKQGLEADEAFKGIDWEWLAMDRGMTKAPLGGGNMWASIRPTGQDWHQAQRAHRRRWRAGRPRRGEGESP
jgi:transposase